MQTGTEPYSQLEAALTRAVRALKNDLSHLDDNYLNFAISVDGRFDCDFRITFRLGLTCDSVHCEGGRLAPVIDEYERRFAWKRKNASLCLPNVDTSQDKPIDDIINELRMEMPHLDVMPEDSSHG